MTWIIEEQENISRKDMLKLVRRTAEEARTRVCANPKLVLLLPPDAEEVFYINTPSSGLWSTKEKLSEICKNLS